VTVATLWATSEAGKCFARPSPFMSAATTLQPSETKRLVIARPKPDAAPVQMRSGISWGESKVRYGGKGWFAYQSR
jgi:hypothetical protein